MFTYKNKEAIQRFGRSLLLPIGVMAPIGMILGVSGAFVQPYLIKELPFLGIPFIHTSLIGLRSIAGIIFKNLPILFAMGVAYGMSKKEKGIAVFSSIVGYIILLATMGVWLKVSGQLATENLGAHGQGIVLGIHTLRLSVLGGIIAGLVAARCTDRFYNLELPVSLAFFGGKKSVAIITSFWMLLVGLLIPFAWQYFISFMTNLSHLILVPYGGPFMVGMINRLLIPFGLHHVWNALLRFTEAGGTYMINGHTFTGELNALSHILFQLGPSSPYWTSMLPKLTRFEAQNQMITTLFAIPGIAVAMYRTSFAHNRPLVKGMLITIVLTAVLGNVTEPMEFSFLFVAPPLYLFHAFMVGVSNATLEALHTAVGYIRGTIFDFIIFGLMYEKTRWYNIILVGTANFFIYYFVFSWAIKRYNLITPGREDEAMVENTLLQEKRYDEVAQKIIVALGGKENILNIDNCITRLRIDLKDKEKVSPEVVKDAVAMGVFFPAKNHIHLVYGPFVEFVRNALEAAVEK